MSGGVYPNASIIGTYSHALIIANVSGELRQALKPRPCTVLVRSTSRALRSSRAWPEDNGPYPSPPGWTLHAGLKAFAAKSSFRRSTAKSPPKKSPCDNPSE